MKRITLFLAAVILFAGCPYESNVPLSGKVHKINHQLIGQYVSCSSEGSCQYLDINKRNDYEYTFKYRRYDTESKSWKYIYKVGFLTYLSGDWYINIKGDSGKYVVSKCKLKGNKLYLAGMNIKYFMSNDNGLIAFKRSQEFCDYVNFMKGNDEFFLSPKIFYRKD